MTFDLDLSAQKLTVKHEGLQDILIDLSDPDRVSVWQGTDQYAGLKPGGGHWEVETSGGLTAQPGGFEVNESGHLLVHEL